MFALKLYQRFISPLLAPSCRYTPTCSEYAHEAIEFHGPIQGSLLAAWRLVRCHPFARGGFDPVPLNTELNRQDHGFSRAKQRQYSVIPSEREGANATKRESRDPYVVHSVRTADRHFDSLAHCAPMLRAHDMCPQGTKPSGA